MKPSLETDIHRRTFLRQGAASLGLLGLHSLLARAQGTAGSHGAVNPLHHPAKAKRVIFLYQAGGPSHLETFDFKPKLGEMDGQPMPASMTSGQQLAQLQGEKLVCWGPQTAFKRYGRCGAEITELFPHVGECGFAGAARSQRSDGMRVVKESNGGRVSAAGEAM